MKKLSIIAVIAVICLSFSAQTSFAKDKSYTFNYKITKSNEVTDAEDLKLLRAAEYSLKKGYDYFVIEKSRTYSKVKKQKNGRLGQKRAKRPQMRTELVIHCYDTDTKSDDLQKAKDVNVSIKHKHSD